MTPPQSDHKDQHGAHTQQGVSRLLDIPELLYAISAFLTPNDLTQCLQVSKKWHRQFDLFLWTNIVISNKNQLHRFMLHAMHPLSLHRHDIRSIRTRFCSILHMLLADPSAIYPTLTKLEFPWHTLFINSDEVLSIPLQTELQSTTSTDPTEEDQSRFYIDIHAGHFDESLVAKLMSRAPRLESLMFATFPFGREGMLASILEHSSRLSRLNLTNVFYRRKTGSIQYLLDHCPPSLEELTVSVSPGSTRDSTIQGSLSDSSLLHQHQQHVPDQQLPLKLRKLELLGDIRIVDNGDDLIWLPILTKCDQLQELSLDLFSTVGHIQLSACLQNHCPRLEVLSLRFFGGPQKDDHLAGLIKLNPRTTLRSLRMLYFHGLGPSFAAALLRHTSTLESIIFEECDGITSMDIQILLGSCPRLHTFHAMTTNSPVFMSSVYLDAKDLLSGPWACEAVLESLKLIINGIPRPDLLEDQYGSPLEGPLHNRRDRHNFDCQRAVYARLGRLTKLRVLWLGHDEQDLDDEENYYPVEQGLGRQLIQWQFIDPDIQFECLEFSLRSGLEQLAELKRLETLNLDRVSTLIGQAEVQWMTQRWPKLKTIVGLVVQGKPIPKAVQWLSEHRPDIDLPPVLGNFFTTR
ncbi:hypothetical protein BGZ94_001019 [Podila epigama]|nr:hypothetical protein BGZ94_001019 [Podila epigama]